MSEAATLTRGARVLGVALSEAQAAALLRLLDELTAWNRAYNLTAIEARGAMLTHHVLDSLSVQPELVGERIADVGTGAGFPGLPLAILNPNRHFTLIDSSGKKIRFVAHAARTLGLENVETRQARAEQMPRSQPFDSVVARALAAVPELLATVAGLCDADTRVIAMKGRYPVSELAALPAPWQLLASRAIEVPGLGAERHLLSFQAPGLTARPGRAAGARPAG